MCSHDPDNKNNTYILDFKRRLRFRVKLAENSQVKMFSLSFSLHWGAANTVYHPKWECHVHANDHCYRYHRSSGDQNEDIPLMKSISGCWSRLVICYSYESQSFSSLIHTSASALWHNLTHIHNPVSICQKQMGWGRGEMFHASNSDLTLHSRIIRVSIWLHRQFRTFIIIQLFQYLDIFIDTFLYYLIMLMFSCLKKGKLYKFLTQSLSQLFCELKTVYFSRW